MLRHFCNRCACVTGTLAAAPDSHSRGGCYTIRNVSMHGHARQAHASFADGNRPRGERSRKGNTRNSRISERHKRAATPPTPPTPFSRDTHR